MTYEQALAYWFGRIDYEKKPALPGEIKLDRMRSLMHRLGDPQDRLRIIHIAGTKGKGSTAGMTASVLQSAGYRVGLFTSPHLVDVSERIQINGVPMSREEIIARIEELQPHIEAMEAEGKPPTFFEIGTAMSFLHFVYRRVDCAIMEVGLGGRFDSTNVCMPLVSIIGNISFDHMLQLGDTLDKIAFEKAGIIKPRRPVIVTARAPEAREVFVRVSAERGCSLKMVERDFFSKYRPDYATVLQENPPRIYGNIELGMLGAHQADNAAAVVMTVEELRYIGFTIPDSAIYDGLRLARVPARLEVVRRSPVMILDCAHNDGSIRAVIQTINECFPDVRRKILVFGVSADKQVRDILNLLAQHFDRIHATKYANNPRVFPPEKIVNILAEMNLAGRAATHEVAIDAVRAAESEAEAGDLILITGSVFLAGEVRPILLSTVEAS